MTEDDLAAARSAAVEIVWAAVYDPHSVGPRVQDLGSEHGSLLLLEALIWVAAKLMEQLAAEQAHLDDPDPSYAVEQIMSSLRILAEESVE